MNRPISIIIPTCAVPSRVPLLFRALESLVNRQDNIVLPIVVVNGSRCVPEIVQSLQRRTDIRCLQIAENGAVKARLAGRRVVDTEFFGILDDDDEYLPNGAKIQLEPLIRDPSVDAVITNGFWFENRQNAIHWTSFKDFQRDPLGSLMHNPWLNPGGILCRTQTVSEDYLAAPQFMEMTFMAMKLALEKKLYFLDRLTYQLYRGTPESLSSTKDFVQGEPEAILQMLALNPPASIRRTLSKKYVASLHTISDLHRMKGDYRSAWRYHLKSLLSPHGIRYLPYTRHLIRPT